MNEILVAFKNGTDETFQGWDLRLTKAYVTFWTRAGQKMYALSQVEYIVRDGTTLNLTGTF